jgi:hypothetical protein
MVDLTKPPLKILFSGSFKRTDPEDMCIFSDGLLNRTAPENVFHRRFVSYSAHAIVTGDFLCRLSLLEMGAMFKNHFCTTSDNLFT